jgi:hypothetical protein
MPTASDLVTDLPADFEVFGQAVATSMADLLGGTTGQVLAKASNTDMDFSWVAQDDSNAIQNTIVDAKGDLIAATANDTPARLAVGTNNFFLQAASGETTGLKWGGTYTAWTPSFSNFTLGNGTVEARYLQVGKMVHAFAKVTLGSTSSFTGSGLQITLPVNAAYQPFYPIATANLYDNGTAVLAAQTYLNDASNLRIQVIRTDGTYAGFADINSTVPFTWTTNDLFVINAIYEGV